MDKDEKTQALEERLLQLGRKGKRIQDSYVKVADALRKLRRGERRAVRVDWQAVQGVFFTGTPDYAYTRDKFPDAYGYYLVRCFDNKDYRGVYESRILECYVTFDDTLPLPDNSKWAEEIDDDYNDPD